MTDLAKEEQRFSRKIGALRAKGNFPAAMLTLLETVAGKQYRAMAEQASGAETLVELSELTTPERHVQGASLLPRASFPLDLESAHELLMAILEDLRVMGSELGIGADRVMEALETKELSAERLFRAYLDEDQEFFAVWAEKTPTTPKLSFFLAQSALTPFIRSMARRIIETRPLNGVWEHGHCPVCGSLPYLSSLETREGLRMMHCSFCQSAYRVARIGCVYCGERDPQKLHYFDVEELRGFRVDLCDQCRMYVKTADFRQLDRISVPVLDDLESLSMDVLAQARGHVRPTLSAFGF
ncbi:formate dehydrogenase accessory protein FdhE [Desulfonatronum sp. SC1]|uniref:formate dehydrogenase accessory protein FdhE n=1 Tax=Desulfonatronum sp. SC1 TaxID=2109626 RepID=UPI000D322F08|nr:formate dehydrogenase accessory protein FdhE [Desulfonatronum sp. SC1]PTN35051.1 formate dehydrogenase accessory protein FdhE [Desulfonatronum sp. SC1]